MLVAQRVEEAAVLRFHHANLGLRPEQEAAERRFLIDVLGYRELEAPAEFAERARWFGSDDGLEIHLSLDPEHQPARMAHTAIEVDPEIERRLDLAGIEHKSSTFGDRHIFLCRDPAGNKWELRTDIPLERDAAPGA
jgi:catechol 2,3-dioxygenase-like lactoylglutathione lyase family enzyme